MAKTLSTFLRAAVTGLACVLLSGPAGAIGVAGAYLAAMQADFRNDHGMARDYLGEAMRADPDNMALVQSAVVTHAALGEIAEARRLADRLAAAQPDNQAAALVRIADRMVEGEFDAAAEVLETAGVEAANPLLAGLLAGWIAAGQEDFTAAQARFDAMTGNDALAAYGQYHKALALALAGDFVSAAQIFAGGEDGPLHLSRGALMAHAQVLAQIDRTDEAVAILDQAAASGIPDAPLADLRARLASGDEVAFDQVRTASDGAAEAFLTLAEALAVQDNPRLALIHARLAAHLRPDLVEARLLVADMLEAEEQYELATAALSEVPESSPWFVTAQIRRANMQRAAGDPGAGIATLTELAQGAPQQIEVHSALADALRAEERYEEAVAAYDAALALVDTPREVHWLLYYTRGIANERAGRWDAAEADFRQALQLQPDQPLVLNYLGYSLVEKGRNLEEALGMIERAVAGQPDDGYITDSLGWVLYRLGRYEDALPVMLRAAELAPVDPVVNDHLGDVLWKVGRDREAVFQWHRAMSFAAEDTSEAEADVERIRRKLDVGLDKVLAEEAEPTDG